VSSIVESAFATTVAERTARFREASRKGSATGPLWRPVHGLTEGIVDFNARRAIVSEVRLAGGLLGRVLNRGAGSDSDGYVLLDDVSLSGWTGERWTQPKAMFQPGVPRLPIGLGFLDLLSGGSLVSVDELGRGLVREAPAEHFDLKLDVDHIPWPQSQGSFRGPQRPGISRILNKLAPPRGHERGVISAEVWIDDHGRLVRFSFCDAPKDHPSYAAMPWYTTELWDFGVPREIGDWRTLPDPATLLVTLDARA
jgi:hypothetical protein